MTHTFESKLAISWPPDRWKGVRTLVAVSGGADSVALLRAMVRNSASRDFLTVAHLNHQLRGAASLADEQFVVALAQEHGLKVEVGQADVGQFAQEWGIGVEEAARRARYEFFARAAELHGARYVALAHTKGDQAETILHRILRGTGLAGLGGIPRVRPLGAAASIIRPMLDFSRSEVTEYLNDIDQPYQRDESNNDLAYARNRIRNELLPVLERDYQRAVSESLVRLGTLAQELQSVIDPIVEAEIQRSFSFPSPEVIEINCALLRSSNRYVARESLVRAWRQQGWPQQAMGFPQWEQLMALARDALSATDSTTGNMLPGSVRAQKKGEQLTLTRLQSNDRLSS